MAELWRAKVNVVTGKTAHFVGRLEQGVPVPTARIPDPDWVEIAWDGQSAFLYRFAADGTCLADTWHESVDSAKRQATAEFEIDPDAWQPVRESR